MSLKLGSSGSLVLKLQKALNALGWKLHEDGSFGPLTKAAVQSFQSSNGLEPDGIVGDQTVSALEAALGGDPHVSPSQPSIPPESGTSPIRGVDVYHLDEVDSWSQMLAGGFEFAFVKASQGLGSDSKFAQYFAGAKAAGLIAGPYHFYDRGVNMVQQASHFAQVINGAGGLEKTDLPPVFDLEIPGGGDIVESDGPKALQFLQKIQELTGRLPMLYCSQSTPEALGNPSWLSKYPLWVARYRDISKGPGISGWTFWQYSESAQIPGLGNEGDANLFQGSLADLRTFISHT